MVFKPFDPDCIGEKTLKITDFDQILENDALATVQFKGTCAWVAPEVMRAGIFSKAGDVWSYGTVLWAILTRKTSCEVENGNFKLAIPDSYPDILRKLMEGCWEHTQENRPLFSVILAILHNMNKSQDETLKKHETIFGLVILNNEVFLSFQKSSVINVCDSQTFMRKRQLTVNGLTNPEHIVSCDIYNCIYSFDWSYRGMACELLSIDPHTGKVMKNWETFEGGGRLSVATDTNIILNINFRRQLHEYTADGELLRRINLACGTDIVQAWHAIKLDSGLYLVCHGDYGDPKSRVCLMSIRENVRAGLKNFYAEVVAAFGDDLENLGNPLNRLICPIYMAVEKDGSILVCDNRLMLLNSSLEEPRQLNLDEYAAVKPWRLCVDESNGRYLVATFKKIYACKKLSDGKIDWEVVLDRSASTT